MSAPGSGRKHGRNTKKCQRYKAEDRARVNKKRRVGRVQRALMKAARGRQVSTGWRATGGRAEITEPHR